MIGLTGINLDFQYIGLKPGSQNPQRYLLKPKNPEAAMRARLLGEGEGRSSRSYECLELKMAGKSVSWLSEMVSCCGSKTSDCFTGRLNSIHPENLGKMISILTSIFFRWVGSTTN